MTHDIFKTYPDLSKIWVYQSAKEFSEEEMKTLQSKIEDFLDNWDSHGSIVTSDYKILYNRFIVILANDTEDRLCGSAADRSIQFIKELEQTFATSIMDRMLVTYREDDKIKAVNINDFRDLIKEGIVTEDTIVFNNVVNTKAAFTNGWEVPLKESWHKQLLQLAV